MSSVKSDRIINMFGGSPLNRLSWLRNSHHFLNAIVDLPRTQWLLFNAGQPLTTSASSAGAAVALLPAYFSTSEIAPFLGPRPYFGQGQEVGTLVPEEINKVPQSVTEAARHHPDSLPVVFLGIHEKNASEDGAAALPSTEFSSPDTALEGINKLDGVPYFAMDIADLIADGKYTEEGLLEVLKGSSLGKEGKVFAWSEPRALMTGLDGFTAAIFACGRSLVDWNWRNRYCPGCGSKTYSMWGGWKKSCSTVLPWVDKTGKTPCPSGKGLHNYAHPRTDPVVIMIAIDETGEKVLLGRGKRFPGMFYSAFAGFIEPEESFEDAVAREMWEEAGVRVWNIRYHSGQPWPYPSTLMVGFYSRADSTKPIRIDLDNELVDARWFTRDEVLAIINDTTDVRRHKELSESFGDNKGDDPAKPEEKKPQEAPIKFPPTTAIAGVLIRAWAERKIGFVNEQPIGPNL